MSVINLDWMVRNTNRRYPLADWSTAIDVEARTLPEDFLVDLAISGPKTISYMGQTLELNQVWVSSVSASPGIVSLTLLASDQVEGEETQFFPLGVINVVRPLVPYKNYAMESMIDGVMAWAVFGPGAVEQELVLLFDGPGQSGLSPRVLSLLDSPPVEAFQLEYSSQKAVGDVLFAADSPIQATIDNLTLLGPEGERSANVLVFDAEARADIQSSLIGPCGGRPESRTCGKNPISSFGPVTPDCAGNIDLVVSGLDVHIFNRVGDEGRGGFCVDVGVTLADVCDEEALIDRTDPGIPCPADELPPPDGLAGSGGTKIYNLNTVDPTGYRWTHDFFPENGPWAQMLLVDQCTVLYHNSAEAASSTTVTSPENQFVPGTLGGLTLTIVSPSRDGQTFSFTIVDNTADTITFTNGGSFDPVAGDLFSVTNSPTIEQSLLNVEGLRSLSPGFDHSFASTCHASLPNSLFSTASARKIEGRCIVSIPLNDVLDDKPRYGRTILQATPSAGCFTSLAPDKLSAFAVRARYVSNSTASASFVAEFGRVLPGGTFEQIGSASSFTAIVVPVYHGDRLIDRRSELSFSLQNNGSTIVGRCDNAGGWSAAASVVSDDNASLWYPRGVCGLYTGAPTQVNTRPTAVTFQQFRVQDS